MRWSNRGEPTPDAREMLRMRRGGALLRELGAAYGGLSRERIRQVLHKTQRYERRLAEDALGELMTILYSIRAVKP